MKFIIKHESCGRMRVQLIQKRMTLEQADQLELYLNDLEMIQRAVVHERTLCAIVEYNGKRSAILEKLSRFSFVSAPEVPTHSSRALNRTYEEKLVGIVLAKAARSLFLPAPVYTAYTIFRAIPYLFRAAKALLCGKLTVAVLDGLSIGLSLIRGDFSTASSVMFLLRLGELLEEWTHKKSVDDLARSMALNIDRVWLHLPEGDVLTPLTQVEPGNVIRAHMGNVIPLDGVVTEGEISVNQASLTGEPVPVPKRIGMTVHAGTVVEEGECLIKVIQLAGHSRYDKIVAMIEQSEKLKSSAENRGAHLADHLVPYTLLGSSLTWLLTRNIDRALSVLMVDFSCALKLALPLAVLSSMREAGNHHITVKGGKYLEIVAKADTIVFDKTGTLTHACPTVARVVPFGGHDENEMLTLAACLEEHFPHSIANAVVEAARDRGLFHDEMHSKVEYLVAHGIASTVGDAKVAIGSAHFIFEDEGCTIPAGEEERFNALPDHYSHLYLAIEGVLAAVICIADPLRTEVPAVIKALKALGVRHTIMLTGDSDRTARAIAEAAGVDEYRSQMLPEDKAAFVESIREQGRTVIMLGDGLNDSPALSAADVGIAVSDGAAIAKEISDITVSADSLYALVVLRRIAAELMARIQSNYRFVIGFNGSLIALGAAGILPPSASALLHNLSTLGISLKSMTNLLPNPKNK